MLYGCTANPRGSGDVHVRASRDASSRGYRVTSSVEELNGGLPKIQFRYNRVRRRSTAHDFRQFVRIAQVAATIASTLQYILLPSNLIRVNCIYPV